MTISSKRQHLQPLPNAFELYGVDFLVSFDNPKEDVFRVSLLEFNAEPAIEMTGTRLHWILEDLFEQIAEVGVTPLVSDNSSYPLGAELQLKQLTCCLSVDLNRR
jgi:hypothetical protein